MKLVENKKKPNTPRAIQLEKGDTLKDIIKTSTSKKKKPDSLLVWRADGGWDLYCLPGKEAKPVPDNKPFPPMGDDQAPDLSKAQVETVTAIRLNPQCFFLNGKWYWI